MYNANNIFNASGRNKHFSLILKNAAAILRMCEAQTVMALQSRRHVNLKMSQVHEQAHVHCFGIVHTDCNPYKGMDIWQVFDNVLHWNMHLSMQNY